MNRKTFLRLTTAAAVGSAALAMACRDDDARVDGASGGPANDRSSAGGLDAPPGERTLPMLGVQLYTLRQLASVNLEAALDAVAEAGYTEVEFTGYYGQSPDRVRDLVRERGLDPVSSHVAIERLREDADATFEAARTVGHRYLIVPYLAEGERTAEGYRALADELNALGERGRDAGLAIGYHNHDFEFGLAGGVSGFDTLLQRTDPELVTFELDFYWIAQGGGDALGTLASNPGRFRLCHLKDRDRLGRMVDVGAGVLAWGRYLEEADQAGLRHFFVEHDTPEDPVQSIRNSHAYLSGLTF